MSEHRSAEKWKGPWKCDKCGFTRGANTQSLLIDKKGCGRMPPCDGEMVPFERRASLQASEERIKELEATNSRLNRRCQSAESAAMQNVEECKKAGVSFGRSLGNWYGRKLHSDLRAAEASRDALKKLLPYVRHHHECKAGRIAVAFRSSSDCTCGLDALLSNARGRGEPYIAGDCTVCGGPIYHRPGYPGEYDHTCKTRNGEESGLRERIRGFVETAMGREIRNESDEDAAIDEATDNILAALSSPKPPETQREEELRSELESIIQPIASTYNGGQKAVEAIIALLSETQGDEEIREEINAECIVLLNTDPDAPETYAHEAVDRILALVQGRGK